MSRASERLLEAMNSLPDATLEENVPVTAGKKRRWKKWAALAACLCVVVLGVGVFTGYIPLLGGRAGQGGSGSDGASNLTGALEAVRELSEVATLAIASNGVARVQASRLRDSGLEPYMDEVFVSEKMGVEKPNRRFFDQAVRTLGIEHRDRVLVVGDSLSADIKGGQNAGLATCWCNFHQKPEPEEGEPQPQQGSSKTQ